MSLSLCPLDREVYRVTFKISRAPGRWVLLDVYMRGINRRGMQFQSNAFSTPKLFCLLNEIINDHNIH